MNCIAKKSKRIFWGILVIVACIFVPQKCVYAGEDIVPTAVDNLSVSLRNKVNMTVTDDGYMRVAYDGKNIQVEYYDAKFNLLRKESKGMELPYWGGFCAGQDGCYYVAEGQSNKEESDSAEVIRVIKYDKNWNRLGAASITSNSKLFGGGGEVRYPFDSGCVEMAEHGDNLYLATGHQGYVDDSVGQGHQGYLMIRIDKTSMKGEIVDADFWHSFAQYIKEDNSNLYLLEQSEGSRCTRLSKIDTTNQESKKIHVLEYGGERTSAWAIACYASVNDLAVSSNNILCIGTSIDQNKYDEVTSDTPHNLYLTITPKNDFSKNATTVKWITDFKNEGASFLGAKITKINEDCFILTWEETGKTQKMTDNDPLSTSILHYVFINGKGEFVSKQYTAPAPISDCHPILSGSKVIYTASSSNMVDFYSIDVNDGTFQKKVYRVAGENTTWNLEKGILRISGTGSISVDTKVHYRYPVSSTANGYSYSSSDNAWKEIREDVKKIVIENGVTSIPDEEFENFSKLEEVEIKDGMKTIGKRSFYGCKNLEKITLPASVTNIGEECLESGWYWIGSDEPVINVKIYAPKDSYAIQYAKQNKIKYTQLGETKDDSNDTGIDTGSKVENTTNRLPSTVVQKNKKENISKKKVLIVGLTSSKNGTIKLKWKKISGIDGYEIQCASNTKFTKSKKKIIVKRSVVTSRTVKKLKKKRKYYVRIRAYKKVKGKITYSKWSNKKSVRCK